MAMTVRFSTDLDARLEALAEERQASKHALVVRAVEELLMRERKTQAVLASIDETSHDYAGLIRRLEDA
jgi:predicted transcriptional regulator